MPASPAAVPCARRRGLTAAGLSLAGRMALAGMAGRSHAVGPQVGAPGARLTADFEPQGAVWLGFDAGHEGFTADLARVLHPHVPLKLLVRDADAQARAQALLERHQVPAARVRYVQHPQALFFVRDAAVFGLDAAGQLMAVDFRWTHYGWADWCRRRHAGRADDIARCADADASGPDGLDRALADAAGASVFSTPLAMEGGGVETNGQGLLIANAALWHSRNPGLGRDALQAGLLRLPGIRKVIWLPEGLAQDPLHRATIVGRHVAWGTGGHTDEFVRFADARTVLLAWPDAAEAARHPVAALNLRRMQRNHAILSRSSDVQGRPLRVLKVPLPRVVERRVFLSAAADTAFSREWTAESFPEHERRRQGDWVMQVASSSYLNYVVANGVLLLPDYRAHGTPAALQAQVLRVMEQAFPGRALRFVDAIGANWVGGGAHCATLSEPRAGA